MLDEMHKSIDVVMVSTPDHNHAPAAAMAMRLGKHCYCEKPLTHSVYETRVLAEIAKQQKLVTQMGTQIHAEDNYRRVVELSSRARSVRSPRCWCGAARSWGDGTRPKETPAVPKNIHWDQWIGPAPFRPYHPCYLPFNWRRWWDFGNGTLGDMACHIMDIAFWALNLRYPTTIVAEGPPVSARAAPQVDGPLRVSRPRRDAAGEADVVRRRQSAALSRRPRYPQRRARRPVHRQGGDAAGGLRLADALPAGEIQGLQAAGADDPQFDRSPQGVLRGVQERRADDLQFRLFRRPDRGRLAGHSGLSRGQAAPVGPVNLKATNCPAADRYLRPHYRKGWTL